MPRFPSYLGLALVLALAALPARAAPAGPLERVIDARTIVVAGETVRLFGILVLGLDEICEAGGKPYPCGRIARTGLMDLVAGAEVSCDLVSGEGTTPLVARCRAGGFDLSANMVHTGWALADRRAGTAFVAIEEKARAAGRGLWRGTFTPPAEWRDGSGESGGETP